MTVLASVILDRVREQIVDPGPIFRWSDTELLKWLSDAQRTLVAAIPQASRLKVNMDLAEGTRQVIPADGFALLTVYRNTGARAISPVERSLMDTQYPDWHTHTANVLAKFFIRDDADAKVFFVYPPNDGFGSVELIYSQLPVELTATTDPIGVLDIYQSPLVDFVCYRAHLKDSDFASGAAAADQYLKAFTAFLEAQKAT